MESDTLKTPIKPTTNQKTYFLNDCESEIHELYKIIEI